MQGIKNLIFDFGNVLFDIDLSRIESRLHRAFGEHYPAARERIRQGRILEMYETGGLSTADFVEAIRTSIEPAVPAEQVTDAWNSIFIGMPAARFDMLLRLRQKYNVFLLSNINELHERWIAEYMLREHGIRDYESRYFDGVYFSHLVRLRKPNRDIFEYVLADAELLPEESVFFDDLEVNVEAARQVGIQGILHPAGSDIIERMAAF
ncbi:MAG: HAD family phosphatase [Saprospiraceae bacterium]